MKYKKGSKICNVPNNLTGSAMREAMLPRSAKFKITGKETVDFERSFGPPGEKTIPVTKYTLEYIQE